MRRSLVLTLLLISAPGASAQKAAFDARDFSGFWNRGGYQERREGIQIVGGCADCGATLPRKNPRQRRSSLDAMSVVATCTISWFIVEYMRSLLGLVSNALAIGATSIRRNVLGVGETPALP